MQTQNTQNLSILLFVFCLFTPLTQKIVLNVLKPNILKEFFSSGFEFIEIMNTHQLQNFKERVDVHLLETNHNEGCSKFSIDHVTNICTNKKDLTKIENQGR
jgi:hypothetical protein